MNASALLNEKPGRFDLRWRMFGTHVRVKPMFWIFMGIFGYIATGQAQKGWLMVVMFVLAGFLSVMVHEFGHITAGRIFGFPGVIVLHMMGGGSAIGEQPVVPSRGSGSSSAPLSACRGARCCIYSFACRLHGS